MLARRKTNPLLTAEQKTEEALADKGRYRTTRLTVEQKSKINVRIETEKRYAESLQVATVRLLDKRHQYATRLATVADSVVADASVSNKVLNFQPEFDLVISSARTTRDF